jgi:hypoxanthine phosphoribosyltransferase
MVSISFQEVTDRLRKAGLPETDLVIGIGTGGVVPAVLAAFHLNASLQVVTINYRDEKNTPQHENPLVLNLPSGLELEGKRVLLVDDVSVSGKTMNTALGLLKGYNVKTLTMKGKADYVLFPEITDCVMWPWK